MNFESTIFEVQDGCAVLKFNRPDSLNALNFQVFAEMRRFFKHVAETPELRAALITGTGRGFCAGADLKPPRNKDDRKPDPEREKLTRGQRLAKNMELFVNPVVQDMLRLEKPIVAAVNGVAAGAGVGIALSADIVIAARSATFVQVFGPQLGVVPDMGCTWHLPRLIGRARSLGLMLLGERLPAVQAAEMGLIWKCVDDAVLMDEALDVALRLAQGPTKAFGYIKKAVLASDTNSVDEQLSLEAEYQSYCVDTEDNREGVVAFIQKRAPCFKGH
ncbi:MAG: enoyl-CoA hydratase/isomerase family protein [Proteobacteria bacterium]|nr:enoyl-CoA hydratase/isomerase family protein [Pseudomonadota bacterium]